MGDFFSFWCTSISDSLGSSWDRIAGIDLAMTVFGGLFLFVLKKSPLSKWSFHPEHPIWNEAWRLLAMYAILFAITLFVYAPFQQFEKEHQQRLLAESENKNLVYSLQKSNDRVQMESDRADGLSDSLNKSKESVRAGAEIEELHAEVAKQKSDLALLRAHALTDSYMDPYEWPALTTDQISEWAKELSPLHVKSLSVFWGQDVEANNLFRSLQTLGRAMGIKVIAGSGQNEGPGFSLIMVKGEPSDSTFQNLLKTFNCPVTVEYYEKTSTLTGDISLFIGERPQIATPSSPTPVKP